MWKVNLLLNHLGNYYYTACTTNNPHTTKLLGAKLVSLHPSVCLSGLLSGHLSICPTSRVRFVAPTVLVGSILYLHILSSNFRRCVACKSSCTICKNLYFWYFLKFVTLTLSCFDSGSDVWVIMRQRRVSQNAGILVVLVVFVNTFQSVNYIIYQFRWSAAKQFLTRSHKNLFSFASCKCICYVYCISNTYNWFP